MGGKSQPDPPDYTPVANASETTARYGKEAADAQLDFAKQQYADYKPTIDRIANSQLGLMDEQMRQGKDYYDYMQAQYRPLESQMVDRAKNFNTDAYREQLAQQAAADAGLAFQNTQAASARNLAGMGVNPNSGRYAGATAASNLGLSAMKANAMTGTRQQAQATGDAMLTNAVGVGRGLVGAANGAYGMALNSGNSASGNSMAAGNNLFGQMGQAYGTAQNGQQMQLNGLGGILNSQTSIYGQQLNSQGEMWGSLVGLGGKLGAAAMGMPMFGGSDRRLKQDILLVGTYPNGLRMYEFAYKSDPQRRWRGVMADEVLTVFPEAVAVNDDGFQMVNYALLGIAMEEV